MSDENKNSGKKRIFWFFLFIGVIFIIAFILFGQVVLYNHYTKITPSKEFGISALSSFYSIVFTIIAIFIGIAAIIGWRWIKDEWAEKEKASNEKIGRLNEISKKFKEVEEKVDFLNKKRELAKWVQGLFDKDDEKKIISSTELPISKDEEKKQYDEIKEQILKEATDDSWLKIVYAKKLVEQAKRPIQNIKSFSYNTPSKKNEIIVEIQNIYNRVDKIFKFIESRDLFKPDSDIEMYLYNLLGQLYLEWYRVQKLEFQTKFQYENEDISWEEWWLGKKDEKGQENYGRLKSSESYYRNALKITEEKKLDEDETLGNLALVLIELSKFPKESKPKKKLEEAKILLHRRGKKDFNNYWDQARVLYYLNENTDQIEKLLDNTVKEIDNKKDRNFFIERLEAELNEIIDGKPGFPGDQETIDKRKMRLEDKNLS